MLYDQIRYFSQAAPPTVPDISRKPRPANCADIFQQIRRSRQSTGCANWNAARSDSIKMLGLGTGFHKAPKGSKLYGPTALRKVGEFFCSANVMYMHGPPSGDGGHLEGATCARFPPASAAGVRQVPPLCECGRCTPGSPLRVRLVPPPCECGIREEIRCHDPKSTGATTSPKVLQEHVVGQRSVCSGDDVRQTLVGGSAVGGEAGNTQNQGIGFSWVLRHKAGQHVLGQLLGESGYRGTEQTGTT